MKKTAWMLALALPFAFASCSDSNDDEPMSLDQTSVSLNYDAETTLHASEKGCIWESSNPFVATVDNNGKITAQHVGDAVITAKKDGKSATCNVTVNATNNNFTMPIINWGNTIAQVKGEMTDIFGTSVELGLEESNSLGYTTAGAFPMYIYAFVDGGLDASSLIVTETQDAELDLEGFIAQRYQEYGETEYGFLYCNAENREDATILVEYGYDVDLQNVRASWTSADGSRSGVIVDRKAIDITRKAANALLNK